MKTLGGGVVRYVGIELFTGTEVRDAVGLTGTGVRDAVGECLVGGTLEVLWGGRVMESFPVKPGDALRVADGATVEPEEWLFSREAVFSRGLRAPLPEGDEAVVRLPDRAFLQERVDELTGLSRREVSLPEGVYHATIELVDAAGRALWSVGVSTGATVVVDDGASVRRGALLAKVPHEYGPTVTSLDGLEAMRRYLDAKTPHRDVACSAPCGATVEAIEANAVILRTPDGRLLRERKRHHRHVFVRVGDVVRAGDRLVDGERSHHRLLRAWGEDRLAEHMLRELEVACALRGAEVPRAYWSLVVRAMLSWRRVRRPGDTGLRRNQVLAREDLDRAQRETLARGGVAATAVTVLRGVSAIAKEKRRRVRATKS